MNLIQSLGVSMLFISVWVCRWSNDTKAAVAVTAMSVAFGAAILIIGSKDNE